MADLASLVDLVMVFTAAEALLLWGWHRTTGRGLPAADYALSLLSGLFLMAALRGVLTPGIGVLALVGLAASGVCHALDLRHRWRQGKARHAPATPD